ncbi:hypothetical protein OF83DRAFT_1089013 [Amylostereum chailletii]|nr:hypothetical protein OF83DRAFT_1089013 [Amylostereum chailletii]
MVEASDATVKVLDARLQALENTTSGYETGSIVGAARSVDAGPSYAADTSTGKGKPRENILHHMLRLVFRHTMGTLQGDPYPDPLEGAREYWLETRSDKGAVVGHLLRPKWHVDWDEANATWWSDLYDKIKNDGAKIWPPSAGVLKDKSEAQIRDVFRSTTLKNAKNNYKNAKKRTTERNRIDRSNKQKGRKNTKSAQLSTLRPTLGQDWQDSTLDFVFHPAWQSSDESGTDSSSDESDKDLDNGDSDKRCDNMARTFLDIAHHHDLSTINRDSYPMVYRRRTQEWCSSALVTRKDLLHGLLYEKNMKVDGKKVGRKKLTTPRVKGKFRRCEKLPFSAGVQMPAWAVSDVWVVKHDEERDRMTERDGAKSPEGGSDGYDSGSDKSDFSEGSRS